MVVSHRIPGSGISNRDSKGVSRKNRGSKISNPVRADRTRNPASSNPAKADRTRGQNRTSATTSTIV